MRTKSLTLILLLVIAGCAACGAGAGAPPVDLPAPITGRVDVSAPDDAGNITITGTAGAVDGGVAVMAVNESEAGVLSLRLLDLLVSPAYAAGEIFPPVCDEAWHACSYAASDGSFTIYLKAASGDAIAIGVVGVVGAASGGFISELLRVTVPESGTPNVSANCSGQGVSGAAADVKYAATGGVPILLRQGSDTATNQLVIGSSSPQTLAITGCHASSLAVLSSAMGDYLVATSTEDRILWSGRLVNGVVRDRRSVTLDAQPLQAAFPGTQIAPLVTVLTPNSVELRQVSPSDGSTLKAVTSVINVPFTRSIRLDTFTMATGDEQALGLAIVGNASPDDTYVILLRADDLTVIRSWKLSAFGTLPNITDGMIFPQENPLGVIVAFALTSGSSGANQLLSYNILCGANPLGITTDIGTCTSIDIGSIPDTSHIEDSPPSLARNLAIWGAPGNEQYFAITRDDGRVYNGSLAASGLLVVPAPPLGDLAVGDDIVAVTSDLVGATAHVYGADATTNAIVELQIPIP